MRLHQVDVHLMEPLDLKRCYDFPALQRPPNEVQQPRHEHIGQRVPLDCSSFIPLDGDVLMERLSHELTAAVWSGSETQGEDDVELNEGTWVKKRVGRKIFVKSPSCRDYVDVSMIPARLLPAGEVPWGPASEQKPANDVWTAWADLCLAVRSAVRLELIHMCEDMKESYRPFNPTDPSSKFPLSAEGESFWRLELKVQQPEPPSEQQEHIFSKNFLKVAALAGFTPISKVDLERTRELKADLLSLPMTVNWDMLDPGWIDTYFRQATDAEASEMPFPSELSDFGGYCFALKRGVCLDHKSGFMLWAKLDSLQSKALLRTGILLRNSAETLARGCVRLWRKKMVPKAKTVAGNIARKVEERLPTVRNSRPAQCLVNLAKKLERPASFLTREYTAVTTAALTAWPRVKEALRETLDRIAGLQVLRTLQPSNYQYTKWLFEHVLKKSPDSKTRIDLISRLQTAWERESRLRQGRPATAIAEDHRDSFAQSLAQGNFLRRVAVEHLPLRELLRSSTLQEPTFQEVLIAYRLNKDEARRPDDEEFHDDGDVFESGLLKLINFLRLAAADFRTSRWVEVPLPGDQHTIHIRRFFRMPMKDIKLMLPFNTWTVRCRPFELIKLDLITLVSVLGLGRYFLGGAHWFVVIPPLFFLTLRTMSCYRRVFVENLLDAVLLHDRRQLDRDNVTLASLSLEAENQIFSECMLAYWSLIQLRSCGNKEVAEARLGRAAADMVLTMLQERNLPQHVVPDLRGALRRLQRWGLICKTGSDAWSLAGNGMLDGAELVQQWVRAHQPELSLERWLKHSRV